MDEELVRRAARGDAEALDALARDRIDRLFSIAIRIRVLRFEPSAGSGAVLHLPGVVERMPRDATRGIADRPATAGQR